MTGDGTRAGGVREDVRLGPYRLVERLGEGGMGVVHIALDRRGRAVALKALRPHVAGDPEARTRLSREVETLSRVRNRHVAPILDADVDGEAPYIVTRWIDGPSLDQRVREGGPLDGEDLHALAVGLADALGAIHAAGIVHRDIKPGNVLLHEGEPVLIDFGIAHVVEDHRLTVTGMVMGTPGYVAPEILEGSDVSAATDWWGWAATLAFAATGRPPFGRGHMEAVLSRVVRGEPQLDGVDPRIEPLLYAALSPEPADRPHHDLVVAALARYAAGGDVTDVLPVRRPPSAAAPSTGPGVTEVLPLDPTRALPLPPPAPASPYAAPPAPVGLPPQQQRPAGPTDPYAPYPGQPPVPDDPYAPVLPPGGDAQGWGAAYEGEGDPRIGRPNRTGSMAALLVALTAAGATAPVVTALVVVVLVAIARSLERTMTATVLRRHERGRRSSDVAVAVAASPVHTLVGLVGAALTALVPALVAVSTAFAVAVGGQVLGGVDLAPTSMPAMAAGAFVGLLTLWWGPGGVALRRGARSLVRGVTPGPAGQGILVGVAAVLVLWAALVAWKAGEATWWPLEATPKTWPRTLQGWWR